MSDGDEEAPTEEVPDAGDADVSDSDVATVSDHLEAASESLEGDDTVAAIEVAIDEMAAALEVATTEAELDDVENVTAEIATALEEAEIPEAEDSDEADAVEELTDRLDDVEDDITSARGPYAEDVIETIKNTRDQIAATRWTQAGSEEVLTTVEEFIETTSQTLTESFDVPDEVSDCESVLTSVIDAIESSDLDPDDDADIIAELLETADTLTTGVDDAEEWADLTTREQLRREGFYSVLEHRKDYPPEWQAVKVWEKRGNAEMVLLALESLGSEFMEQNCLNALERMGPEEAIEPMIERADRRDKQAIRILGKIGSPEALDTIEEYAAPDTDDELRRVALKAVGEIGSNESTKTVAQGLMADTEGVRSTAARALGCIGDPRAIEPLKALLQERDTGTDRASAAWALVQIGTRRALESVAEYATDESPLIRAEAKRATSALAVSES